MLAFLALVLSLFHSHVTNYTRMVDHVSASVVRLTIATDEGQGICTGFVIGENRVLTAGHCLGTQIQVDGQQASPIKTDTYYDLMLVKVKTSKPALEFSDTGLWRFETLTAIGYGFGWTRLTALHVSVTMLDQAVGKDIPPGIIVETQYIGGMSGGPVVDEQGHIVGIVQQGAQGLGYGVGTQLIKAFLLGT